MERNSRVWRWCNGNTSKGLTKFGRQAIPKLEQHRIVVDISRQ
ncbi:MAG: hypothetical protein ACLSCV_05815 [Acutalibacteraceae bacterium]